MGYVYALSLDGAEFRYVGATGRTVQTRLLNHRAAARAGKSSSVHRWMREAGPEEIVPTILEETPDDQLWEREVYWIARLRSEGYDLLNLSHGGPGNPGVRYDEEHRERLGDLRRGKPHRKRHEFRDPERQVDSGALGAHNRWHVARNKTSSTCALCAV